MIDLIVRFREPVNLLIFLALSAAATIWVYLSPKKRFAGVLAPFILVNLIVLLAWGLSYRFDHDEATHLHLSWLVGQGFVPYRDFWQHHPPLFWVLLAPLIKLLPASPVLFDMSRIASGTLLMVNAFLGWQISKKCWQEKARLSVYLLVLSACAVMSQFLILRPDLPVTFLLLCGIYISFELTGSRRSPALIAGIAFGLAGSFLPKQYLVYLVPVVAILYGAKGQRPVKLALYSLGLGIGFLPLLAYLAANQILGDYFYWVFNFNRRIIVFSAYFPVAIAALAGWSAVLLRQRARELSESGPLLVFYALLFSSLSSLSRAYGSFGEYNMAFWSFIAAISVSGCQPELVLKRISSPVRRALVTGVILVSLVTPGLFRFRRLAEGPTNYSQDKANIAAMLKYCRGDTCLVLPPVHPIFAHDATRLSCAWQFIYTGVYMEVRNDARKDELARQIISRRPALVACNYQGKDFLLEMFQNRLIKAEGYKQLVRFIRENYTRREIGRESYYVRNDKL